MTLLSDRMQWPYPDIDEDPWYETFQGLIAQQDASGYAAREDRHLIISTAASVSFTASTGVLGWTAGIDLVNAISGHILTIPTGSITLNDGQLAYLVLVRSPLSNANVTLTVASSVPNTNDALAFCVRRGASVYLIRGCRINDGQSINPFDGGGGGGGGGGVATALQTATTQVGVSSSVAPSNGQVLVASTSTAAAWTSLNLDMIAAGFTISSFGGPSSPVEVGATVSNPAFTASYNRTPAGASMNDGSGAVALTSSFTSFAYGTTPLPSTNYTITTPNTSKTWTLQAHEAGGPTKSATVSVSWQARGFFDVKTPPGSLNAAFIATLTGSALEPGFARTIAFGAGSGTKKLYYAFPSSFGTPSTFVDTSTGFAVPFSRVATSISVTNGNSVTLNYDIWASDNFLTSAVNIQVS